MSFHFGPEQLSDLSLPARQTFDQREADACFPCAIATTLEARHIDVPRLSPAFHLYHAFEGRPAVLGLTFTSAYIASAQFGHCRQSLYDFDVAAGTPKQGPVPDALADGFRRRSAPDPITGMPVFRQLAGVHRPWEWLNALRAGFPVVVRIWLNQGYADLHGAAAEPVWTDQSNPGRVNHAVTIVGYRAEQHQFVIQDSRGAGFGWQGRWFLPERQAELGPIEDSFVIETPIANLI